VHVVIPARLGSLVANLCGGSSLACSLAETETLSGGGRSPLAQDRWFSHTPLENFKVEKWCLISVVPVVSSDLRDLER
jgi:hypothetical protein